MRSFRVDLELSPDSTADERTALALLTVVARRNLDYLRQVPTTPALYDLRTRVRYQADGAVDVIAAIPAVLRSGRSDCAGLACWRAAELLRDGVPATLALQRRAGPVIEYHAVVRTPAGLEDPTLVLIQQGRATY